MVSESETERQREREVRERARERGREREKERRGGGGHSIRESIAMNILRSAAFWSSSLANADREGGEEKRSKHRETPLL